MATALLKAVDGPVVAASANRAGQPPPTDASSAVEELAGDVALVLDAGPTRYNKASTIVRVDAGGLTVVREGVLDAAAVRRLSGRRVTFVCTGNICQVPSCSDVVQNGTETDVDCGGASCGPCADGLGCVDAADCQSGVCSGGTCQVPTCIDLVKNGHATPVAAADDKE